MGRCRFDKIIMTAGVVLPVIVFFLLGCFLPRAFSAEQSFLEKGISQYKEENFEEAIEILKKAREKDPDSSSAAYFLGLAYKQVIDYPNAATQLRDAANLEPTMKEAVLELIAVLFRLDQLEDANTWIEKAEKEDIFPAKTAYLKGLVLRKEGKNLEAIESFEKAKSLDESLSQPAEFQIALCCAAEGKYDDAKKRLETSIQLNPQTGLAGYARLYKDLVEERRYLERPLRFTLGVFGQYDTNLVLKPVDPSSVEGISDRKAWALLTSMRVDYTPKLKGPWLFSISNTLSQSVHNKHTHTHDYFADTVSAILGYSFGKVALNVAGNYSLAVVRDPSYKQYVYAYNLGPLLRVIPGQNHILEGFAGYQITDYFDMPTTPDDDRDSEGLDIYLSWIWLFHKNGFLNLRYDFLEQDTDGKNRENLGHIFSANVTLPLSSKVSLQTSGFIKLEDYENIHSTFGVKRNDDIYTGSIGLTWELARKTYLIAPQYTRVRSDSNISIYDYERDVYTAGIEFRF